VSWRQTRQVRERATRLPADRRVLYRRQVTTAAPAVPAPAAEPRALGPILPLRAFPLVGVVLGGLVVAIAGNWEWALTFYHVVGGALWTSIDLFVGFVIGPITADSRHVWVVASMGVVGVMAVVALAILSPANLAVLFELRKPQPDPTVIASLMRRFVYAAGITGAMQVATLVIMTRLAS
jgi:hypothetical protein